MLKVKSFSCNYRDKGLLAQNYLTLLTTQRTYLPFGSEFAGEVVDIGSNVSEFQKGDLVIPNCAYADLMEDGKLMNNAKGPMPGVVTNFASLGWLRIHKSKLLKKCENLNMAEASCFSLGAQTAYSMIRTSGILNGKDTRPVIYNARSATGIFLTQILKSMGYDPLCVSRSPIRGEDIGTDEIRWDSTTKAREKYIDYATHAFDPFYDLNALAAIQSLRMEGTYTYCGLYEQHPALTKKSLDEIAIPVRNAMTLAIIKNITIKGNCLGRTDDLKAAIQLYEEKKLKPVVDSVFQIRDALVFLTRSFLDRDKFGKCVMMYES